MSQYNNSGQHNGGVQYHYQPSNAYVESSVLDQYLTWTYPTDTQNSNQSIGTPASPNNPVPRKGNFASPMVKSDSDVEVSPYPISLSPVQTPSGTQLTCISRKKRREQNRRAQKTHRDRKEGHIKYLENQLEQMTDHYKRLNASYTNQSQQLSKLRGKMEELQWELRAVREASSASFAPAEFDATRMGWHGAKR